MAILNAATVSEMILFETVSGKIIGHTSGVISTAPVNGLAFGYVQSGENLYRMGGASEQSLSLATYETSAPAPLKVDFPNPETYTINLIGGSAYIYNDKVYAGGGLAMIASNENSVPIFGPLVEFNLITNTATPFQIVDNPRFGFLSAQTAPILEKDGLHYAFIIGGIVLMAGITHNLYHARICLETGVIEYASLTTDVAPLPYPQHGTSDASGACMLSVVQINPRTYIAIGGVAYWDGLEEYTVMADVVQYDITTNSFTTLAPLPSVGGSGSAMLYNNKIYYVSGLGEGFTPANNVYCYDIALDSWDTLTPMPGASRYMCSAGLYNGKIYILDGTINGVLDIASPINNVTRPMDVYDIASDTWSTQAIIFTA